MAITPLPPSPSRAVPATFSTLADAFLGALPTFVTEANALEANVNSKESEYIAAAASAALAAASANFKGAWASLTGAAAIPYSVSHLSRYWMLITATSDITADIPGTSAKWQEIGNVTQQDFRATVNPKAFAQGVNLTAAASGSNGIQVADDGNIDFGTGNFTLAWRGSLPDWTPAADVILIQKITGGVGYQLDLLTTGYLELTLNALTFVTTSAINATDGTAHEIIVTVTVGSTQTTVSFYVDGILLQTPAAQNNTTTVSSAAVFYAMGTSAVRTAGSLFDAATFNRALTAAQVLDLYRNGIDFADKWGSQTALPLLNGGFASDTASWTPYQSSLASVAGGQSGNCLELTLTGGVVQTAYQDLAGFVVGKMYRYTAWVKSGTSGDEAFKITVQTTDPVLVGETAGNSSSTWTSYDVEVTATATTLRFDLEKFTGTAGTMLFDTVSIVEIGATLALESEGIQSAPGQWLDSSSNKLHAKMPIAGASLVRSKRDFTVKWTNTWAGTHEAQYISGINESVLPPNCYITSIIGVVAGGTIEDIIVGDGSDTDHWVTITTGLAAGTVAFTIASPISDATNYKLVVDPDAVFTGSIAWTIMGFVL